MGDGVVFLVLGFFFVIKTNLYFQPTVFQSEGSSYLLSCLRHC